jgi:hypothetical protein
MRAIMMKLTMLKSSVMKSSLMSLALISLLGLSVTTGAKAADPLTFGEKQTIRIMAGQTIGFAMQAILGINQLAIISNRSAICTSLVGGIGGAFLAYNPAIGSVTYESVVKDQDSLAAVKRMKNHPAIYLAFGGEKTKEENLELLRKVLSDMATLGYNGKIIFHVTTWSQKQVHDIIKTDATIATYLAKADMTALTLDLPNSQVALNRVTLSNGELKLHEFGRVGLRQDLVALFKRG